MANQTVVRPKVKTSIKANTTTNANQNQGKYSNKTLINTIIRQVFHFVMERNTCNTIDFVVSLENRIYLTRSVE